MFGRPKAESHRPAVAVWVDGTRVQPEGGSRAGGLRGGLEAVGRGACFDKDVTFDTVGHGFRLSFGRLGLAVVIEVIRSQTVESHMRPPSVIPAFEFGTEEGQVVKPLDKRNAPEPLVLECLDDPLCYGDRSVFAHSSQTRLDVPLSEQLGEDVSDKDLGLVRDDVLRCPMFSHRLPQSLDDPAGVRSFQRSDAHDLAGEMVDGHQDVNGPQPPAQDFRGVDRPDVIGIPGRDRAGLGLLFGFLAAGRGGRRVWWFRPLQDVSHRRGRQEDAQQSELIGDANAAPTEIRFGNFPNK